MTGGFGYDPAFVPADYADGRTMAELTPEEKDAISHRGRAARRLRATEVDSSPRTLAPAWAAHRAVGSGRRAGR